MHRKRHPALGLLLPMALVIVGAVGLPSSGQAEVISVTTAADAGPGSLREAMAAANAGPGGDEIFFEIPGAGIHTIALNSRLPLIKDRLRLDGFTQGGEGSYLIEIDGTNLTDEFSSLLVVQGHHFGEHGDNSVIRGITLKNVTGLNSWGVSIGADGVLVEYVRADNNYGGVVVFGETADPDVGEPKGDAPKNNEIRECEVTNSSVFGIVTEQARNNLIRDNSVHDSGSAGIFLSFSDRSEVIGNHVTGADTGVAVVESHSNRVSDNVIEGSPANGIVVWNNSSYNKVEHNTIFDAGENGIFVVLGATQNSIVRNVIDASIEPAPLRGVNVLAAGPSNRVRSNEISNVATGIEVFFSDANTHVHANGIWDTEFGVVVYFSDALTVVSSNEISRSGDPGSAGISFAASRGVIEGNRVENFGSGVDMLFSGATLIRGNTLLSNETGIRNLFGGNANHMERNVIFGNGAGILLSSDSSIWANSIFDNVGLGIDRDADGVDPLGKAGGQNYPTIAVAETTGKVIAVAGMLESAPLKQYRLDFYSNESEHSSGFGEGQSWLGFLEIETDVAGEAAFSFRRNYPGSKHGSFATATATLLDAGLVRTSEFSEAVSIDTVPKIQRSSISQSQRSSTTSSAFRVSLLAAVDRLGLVTLEEAAHLIEEWPIDHHLRERMLQSIASVSRVEQVLYGGESEELELSSEVEARSE